ncbi:MAG: PilZ domain-containing protein [Candidatus Omnitrophota bacterium]
MRKSDLPESERRKYLRLDTVFPVQLRLVGGDGRSFISDWLQGFTSDIGKGGICIRINKARIDIAEKLKQPGMKLSLSIELPIGSKAVNALAKIAWLREDPRQPGGYLVGVSYEQIDTASCLAIMRYAWSKKLFAPVLLSCIGVLAALLAVNAIVNYRLTRENSALVKKLVSVVQDTAFVKKNIKEIGDERRRVEETLFKLQARLQNVAEEKFRIAQDVKHKESLEAKKEQELNSRIENLTTEKSALEARLAAIQRKENIAGEELLRLDKRRVVLEKANFDKMYRWLEVHQNPRTGLVMSFEGDADIAGWAFIYDQSLIAQVYAYAGDYQRCRRLLNFFSTKAKREKSLFFNAYYANEGDPAEYVVHAGPNIWLGIAACQYTNKSKDSSYLSLAEEIAGAIMDLQNQDPEGGIRGGPGLDWYSTEHNLDAYAFFRMLYKITGEKQYNQAAERVLGWLLRHTYDKTEVPIKRGKGDSTIATDTYAWSIAAVGPEKLEAIGMNPDRIIEFAEQNCSISVDFLRPEGRTVQIKGFDFAPQRHSGRGGVVSSEWTAQMTMAFKIMSGYYLKKGIPAKAQEYAAKADDYLSSLGSMIISSASASGQGEGCLPCATQEHVDTGHGWMTPKGKSTGSVAGTAYTLFVYYNYNPLELKD